MCAGFVVRFLWSHRVWLNFPVDCKINVAFVSLQQPSIVKIDRRQLCSSFQFRFLCKFPEIFKLCFKISANSFLISEYLAMFCAFLLGLGDSSFNTQVVLMQSLTVCWIFLLCFCNEKWFLTTIYLKRPSIGALYMW